MWNPGGTVSLPQGGNNEGTIGLGMGGGIFLDQVVVDGSKIKKSKQG